MTATPHPNREEERAAAAAALRAMPAFQLDEHGHSTALYMLLLDGADSAFAAKCVRRWIAGRYAHPIPSSPNSSRLSAHTFPSNHHQRGKRPAPAQ